MNAEVFISYASKDRDRILDLVDRLDAAGVSVWIDQMSIEGATMWSQEIVSAIRNCKVLILAISSSSADSENVVKELALASEGRKRILPVYLESAEIPESMAYQLAGIQRVEFFDGDEEVGQQSVFRALAKLGVTVSEEASTAAAGAPKRTRHGASRATTSEVAKSEKAAWRKIAAVVGGVAVLAAGIFFLGSRGNDTTEQIQTLAIPQTLDTNRVVVLPFKTIGTSGETTDLGYGLVSTLTSKLQPLQNLVVIAKESARKYKASEQSPREIGQALDAGTIVTGEIQTGGGNIQVNIQLINANTEALGWGSTFMKSKDEFLNLQNEIATSLASKIKGELQTQETQQLARKATQNLEAQAAYQAGRREWNKRSKEGFESAIKKFEQAIKLDKNYADPYVGLGDTYGLMPVYDLALASEAMPKAKAYAEEAIKLNPNLAGPYTLIGWVQSKYEYDWTGAEKSYLKAISLNSNHATTFHWYGIHLRDSGRFTKAVENLNRANKIEPTSKIIKSNLAVALEYANETELAIKIINEALEIDPHFPFALRVKYIRLRSEEHQTLDRFESTLKVHPFTPSINQNLFEYYWRLGEREKAKDQLIFLLTRYETFSNTSFAQLLYSIGDKEEAFRYLSKAFELNETQVLGVAVDPRKLEFQSELKFREMFKKINHPMYIN